MPQILHDRPLPVIRHCPASPGGAAGPPLSISSAEDDHDADANREGLGRDLQTLADALYEETGKKARRVVKEDGATNIEGLMLSGEFRDEEED
jgi:hypothetical protein